MRLSKRHIDDHNQDPYAISVRSVTQQYASSVSIVRDWISSVFFSDHVSSDNLRHLNIVGQSSSISQQAPKTLVIYKFVAIYPASIYYLQHALCCSRMEYYPSAASIYIFHLGRLDCSGQKLAPSRMTSATVLATS